jgi:hypothetical protein
MMQCCEFHGYLQGGYRELVHKDVGRFDINLDHLIHPHGQTPSDREVFLLFSNSHLSVSLCLSLSLSVSLCLSLPLSLPLPLPLSLSLSLSPRMY